MYPPRNARQKAVPSVVPMLLARAERLQNETTVADLEAMPENSRTLFMDHFECVRRRPADVGHARLCCCLLDRSRETQARRDEAEEWDAHTKLWDGIQNGLLTVGVGGLLICFGILVAKNVFHLGGL